jgi:hypothetical protein
VMGTHKTTSNANAEIDRPMSRSDSILTPA